MDEQVLLSRTKMRANFRLCNVSSCVTELLEIRADEPNFHVLVLPGNPGVASFYKDFVESLYELLGGSVSVTAVGNISHSEKNWEHGKLFSLQEQIDHKVEFINQELKNITVPILLFIDKITRSSTVVYCFNPVRHEVGHNPELMAWQLVAIKRKVGHSIGAYISLEIFKRTPKKVMYYIGLYPFLALNMLSEKQSTIGKIAESSVVSVALSSIVGLLGLLPIWFLRLIVGQTLGKSWSPTAVEVTCSHLAKYHTMRNILFMAMTEFKKLSETPDWEFMRENSSKIAFLFGIDDHWGPLQMFEEISKQAPEIGLSIEREGHTHAFCCTEAGSLWVAQHVASLIKNQTSKSTSSQ